MKILFYCRGEENLAIELLSAIAKQEGCETDIIIDPGFEDIFFISTLKSFNPQKIIEQKIISFKPDLIAVSSTTHSYAASKRFAQFVKKISDAKIIIGGPHATACYEEVLADNNFDYAVIGEGENAFRNFIQKFEQADLEDIANLCYKKNNKIIANSLGPLTLELDSLPYLDKDIYFRNGVFKNRLTIMCSRGCFFHCAYCSHGFTKKIYGNSNSASFNIKNYARSHSTQYIIKEILHFKNKYPLNYIRFWDEMFGFDKEWLNEFLRDYSRLIKLPFGCTMHAAHVNSESIEFMKKSGCRNISIGVESGSAEIKKNIINRNTSDAVIINAAEIIKKNKINLLTENIFGFPGEKPEDMDLTIKLNHKIKPKNAASFIFFPLPGTELFDYCVKNNHLPSERAMKIKHGSDFYNSWHKKTAIEHPHSEYAWKMKIYLPLSTVFPLFKKLIKFLLNINVFQNLLFYFSLVFIDFTEFRHKLADYLRILFFLKRKQDEKKRVNKKN